MALLVIETTLVLLHDLLSLAGDGNREEQARTMLDQPLGQSHLRLPEGIHAVPLPFHVPLLEGAGEEPYTFTIEPISLSELFAGETARIEQAIESYQVHHQWVETQMVNLLDLGPKTDLKTPLALANEVSATLSTRSTAPWNDTRLREATHLLHPTTSS